MRNDRLFYGIGAFGLMGLGLVWGHMAAATIAVAAALYLLCDRVLFGQTPTAEAVPVRRNADSGIGQPSS